MPPLPRQYELQDADLPSPDLRPWQQKLHEIIFEADTFWGKAFDVALLIAILASIIAVMLETVQSVNNRWGTELLIAEWIFTILFTIEYILRLLSVGRPRRYVFSFFGIVDLLAILPTYLSIFVGGTQAMIVIRALRLIRVFRVFKLARYLSEVNGLIIALRRTSAKITVFLVVVLTIVLILGSAMYLIEGPANDGFSSIPKAVYWAIITMTTVGYGDIVPQTVLGQFLASFAMIIGYSIIIVPTGIFSVEVIMASREELTTQACQSCTRQGHDIDAKHCKYCGASLMLETEQ